MSIPFRLVAGIGLAAVTQTPLVAAEIVATGVAVPFFDLAGRPTHKLQASRATMVGSTQRMEEVEIVYFSAKDPTVVVQRVKARDAMWDQQKEILTGSGHVDVVTEQSRLTGEGFDFALGTSLLHIHRAFSLSNSEMKLTSDRAKVDLLIERAGDDVRVRDVKRCEAIGNLEVVVQPGATREFPFEKAYSEIAIYDGATQVVTLPKPTRGLKNGAEGWFEHMEIGLRAKDRAKRTK